MKFNKLFTATTLSLALSTTALAQSELTVKIYNADEHSFSVTSTIIEGEHEVMVIDTGFTRADALRIAANVLDSNKTLKTILISNADPDFYFGAETLKQIFPHAQVVTSPAVLTKIKAKLQNKLDAWSPKMGVNAPTTPVIPTALTSNVLELEGNKIEIRGTTGVLGHRPYVWIPSIKTITGSLGVFGHMHVWTADTPTMVERNEWLKQLDEMKALKPSKVIPAHAQSGAKFDISSIDFTKNYLETFERALKNSKNSEELIKRMEAHYPKLGAKAILNLGAKVNMGEMKW